MPCPTLFAGSWSLCHSSGPRAQRALTPGGTRRVWIWMQSLPSKCNVIAPHCINSSMPWPVICPKAHSSQADYMFMDDILFADLLDILQAHLKRPRTDTGSSPGKAIGKGRLKNRSDSSTTSSRQEGDTELLQMIAKLNLRQEDLFNQISMDRSFLLLLQARKDSILPTIIFASKEWHQQPNRQA